MSLIPITLGIARPLKQKASDNAKIKQGRAGISGSASLSNKKIPTSLKKKIFERDNFTCQCCGFKAQKYQEIHFINHDHTDLNENNLATTCIFCHQCFNLESVNDMRSGVLLWLPEIQQTDLHHMARAIYVARISQGSIAETARKSLDILMMRREEVKKRISTDDPYILATIMQDYLGLKHYEMRKQKLDGVKLFPLDRRIIKEANLEFNQFPQILAYWRAKDGPFSGKTPPQWISIYQNILKTA